MRSNVRVELAPSLAQTAMEIPASERLTEPEPVVPEAAPADELEPESSRPTRDMAVSESTSTRPPESTAKRPAVALQSEPPLELHAEHESFFLASDHHFEHHEETGIELPVDPKLEQKMRPEVRARRAKLTRVVQWTVATLAMVCVCALAKLVAAHGLVARTASPPRAMHDGVVSVAAAAAQPLPSTSDEVAKPNDGIASAASPSAPVEQPAAPGASAPSAVEEAPAATVVAAAPVPETAPAQPAAEHADGKTATEEKRDARTALERSSFAKAVEAGERSVALDRKDGEAWLILGAAYQSLGKLADARRSFLACSKEATTGPVGECRAMLQ
jgi:hypothetical protein